MRTFPDVASRFAEQALKLLVENVGAENIGEASNCVPDQSDSFQKLRLLNQQQLQMLL